MKCPGCPSPGDHCLGESIPRLCELARTRPDYRGYLGRHVARVRADKVELRDALAAVSGCPARGSPLPTSLQAECGCGELTECRDGHGSIPGRVNLRECLSCVIGRAPGSAPADQDASTFA